MTSLRFLSLLLVSMSLGGCAKSVATQSLSDDERLDRYASIYEEIHTKAGMENVSCKEWCQLKERMKDVADSTCDISARRTEREDIQRNCITYKEELARVQEQCASCK